VLLAWVVDRSLLLVEEQRAFLVPSIYIQTQIVRGESGCGSVRRLAVPSLSSDLGR
jgi:hypothetical protein